MDRNQAVGLFLISALLIVYMFFFSPEPEKKKTADPANTTASTGSKAATSIQPADAPLDSAAQARLAANMGTFGAAATGIAQTSVLENKNLKVTFNTKGGAVEEVLLKNFKTFDQKPLLLFDKNSSQTDIAFKTRDGKELKLSDLFFTASPVSVIDANG